jgi:putative ABC transport system permease protein
MSIPLRSGRHIAAGEPAPVVVVNETAARRFWPGEDPLGRRVRFSMRPDAPWFTVIGVAGDVRMRGPREGGRTEMYLPYWHFPEPGTNVVLKAQGSPVHLTAALRSAVRDIDPDMPVSGVGAMEAIAAESIAEPRFLALLTGGFAVLALALAAVGIYGVMSYVVAARTNEIGVRIALGAGRADVLRLVAGEGLALAAAGALLGFGAAFALSRSLGALLFETAPGDPGTYVGTAAVVLGAALLAGVLPARRALRVDPALALRAD